MILSKWKTQQKRRLRAEALYRAVVTQTRRPDFYRDGGIADTFEGRFDVLVLHMAMILYRLKGEGLDGKTLGQKLFDLFFADMDAALRELGVGDTSVGKRIREMSEAFYGRLQAYDAGLEASEDATQLREAVARNVYGGGGPSSDANSGAIADYMRRTVRHMQTIGLERLAPAALFVEPPAFPLADPVPAEDAAL